MNKQEAKIILEIMTTTDGDCPSCAFDLMEKFYINFPRFTKLAKRVFENHFEKKWDDFRKEIQ